MMDFFRTYGEIGKKATALFLTEEKRRFAFWEEWLMDGLIRHSETINRLLARYGVKFGIYKNGEFKEQLFPFDPIPRVIGHEEFCYLEKGLRQRVDALNCFLRAFVLTGSSTEVWPSGLTRFSRNPNSFAESDHPSRTILNGIEVVS